MENMKLVGTYLFEDFDIQAVESVIRKLIDRDIPWKSVYFSDIDANVISKLNMRVVVDYSAYSIPKLDLMIFPDGNGYSGILGRGMLRNQIKEHIIKGGKILAVGNGIKFISSVIDDIKVVATDMQALEIEYLNDSVKIDKNSDIIIDGNICTILDDTMIEEKSSYILSWV